MSEPIAPKPMKPGMAYAQRFHADGSVKMFEVTAAFDAGMRYALEILVSQQAKEGLNYVHLAEQEIKKLFYEQ